MGHHCLSVPSVAIAPACSTRRRPDSDPTLGHEAKKALALCAPLAAPLGFRRRATAGLRIAPGYSPRRSNRDSSLTPPQPGVSRPTDGGKGDGDRASPPEKGTRRVGFFFQAGRFHR